LQECTLGLPLCLHGLEITNIFRTGSETPRILALIFNNLIFQNRKCQKWTKNSFEIYKRSFLILVCDNFRLFFSLCYEKSKFQCLITSLLLVLEQKKVLSGYRRSYPRNVEMKLYLNFDLYLKVKPMTRCLF
jgi:hypothetical protein